MLATAPVIVKFSHLSPLVILVWRLFLVAILLFIPAYQAKIKISKSELKHIAMASIFMFLHFYTWFTGIKFLPVGLTTIIYATNPIYTAIIGHFFIKEKFNKIYMISFCLSLIGILVAMATKAQGNFEIIGVAYIVLAAVFYSSYMVYSKRNRTHLNNYVYNFILNIITMFIGAFFLIATHLFSPLPELFPPNFYEWKILFLMAIFPSILGHTLMIYNVKHFNLNFISCFKLISPLFASFLAYIFFKEKIDLNLIIGFSFVALGVVFALPWKKKNKV